MVILYKKQHQTKPWQKNTFLSTQHVLSNWKCVLHWCDKYPIIAIPIKEETMDTTNTCLTIFFMSRETYHAVTFMEDFHTNNEQLFHCVPQCLELIQVKIIHTEGTCVTRDIYHRIPCEVLHSININ